MKKLVIALASLAAMFVAAVSGCAADKPQTPPAQTGDQTKPAASAHNKIDAGKQADAGKKAEGGNPAAGATVSAPNKAETGKQPDTTKKADAGAPAAAALVSATNKTETGKQSDTAKKADAGAPAAAATGSAQNKAKARRDAEPQYRDEDILGTRTGPDGKVEKVIRPGAKPIQAGDAAKQPDVAKKAPETPAAAGAQQAKPSAPMNAAGPVGRVRPGATADAKKDPAGKKPDDKSLAKKAIETGPAAAAGKSAHAQSSLTGKKQVKKAAHGKRHRKRYATRSHRRHRYARHRVRHRYAHRHAGTYKYARRHKRKHVKAHKVKRTPKNVAAKPAAAPQAAPVAKKEAKPAGALQENKAPASQKSAK
jgi:hypothetical protein